MNFENAFTGFILEKKMKTKHSEVDRIKVSSNSKNVFLED